MTERTPEAAGSRGSAAAAGRVELRRWRRRRIVWIVVTVVLAAVWVSSAWWGFSWLSPNRRWSGGIATGVVGLVHRSPNDTMIVVQGFYGNPAPRLRWMPVFERIPVGMRCLVPIWPFVLVGGAMSLRAMRRGKRLRQRLSAGQCIRCGYELAGVPASGDGGRGGVVCPECGSAATGNQSEPRAGARGSSAQRHGLIRDGVPHPPCDGALSPRRPCPPRPHALQSGRGAV